ncbi:MAG: transcriptional repressor [Kiritimatiellae bacterium]|nr:transcriptional repressor [Kiritimatiellia bacterium]
MTKELTIDAFPAFCRERGLKCTAQRMAVFAAVRESESHPSVDDTLAAVRKTVPTVTRDSVYRILNEFSSLGLLARLDALQAARYDTRMGPHAHFICEECGAVFDYPIGAAPAIPDGMPSVRRHVELRVTGLCDRCAAASARKIAC